MTQKPSSSIPGYHGRYLRINLSDETAEFIPLSEDVLRSCLGGSGLGVHLLTLEGSAAVDPFLPAAAIAFVFSPLVGSPLTTSAKFAVVSKSPLTDRINDSLASSHFAIAGKACGCDAMVLVGQAAAPTILVVDDGHVCLEPAGSTWGMEIPRAETELHQRFDDNFRWAVIGPAGERLVRYATISHNRRHAGRGGSGAILGSKNVKAIGVRGRQQTTWANPQALIGLSKELSRKSFGPATAKYRELGTASNLLTFNRFHALPTRNFQQGSFAGAVALSPEKIGATYSKTQASCACCTIGCEHIYGLKSPGAPASEPSAGVRLEYENLFALGPMCGIDDPAAVLSASQRCDALGLDTISTGGTIAFAMECVERGLLAEPWLQFGNGNALIQAIELIGKRDGIGSQLSQGSRHMAHDIGNNAIDFAPQVKGLELPGYEPRALQTMALGFAVGTRGADHNRSGAYEVDFSGQVDRRDVGLEAVPLAIETEDKSIIMDSAILCKFLRGVFIDFFAETAEILNLVTGWKLDATELRNIAQRIVTAKKKFNIEAGWTPKEDTLPDRFLSEKLPDDARAALTSEKLQELVREYNLQRGWSADGWMVEPAAEKNK
jgi:aldehyde:ferredoxin oxidoreductase